MAFLLNGAKPFPVTIADSKRAVEALVAPLFKVGLVLVRDVQSDDPMVFLTQVKSKNPGEQHEVDFGLPKGTRRYLDKQTNQWVDARDMVTAKTHKADLETLSTTLFNEADEELGIPKHVWSSTPIREVGTRPFLSRKGPVQDVIWYAAEATLPLLEAMDAKPKDANAVVCVRMSQLREMEEEGYINSSYVEVAEEAVSGLRARNLKVAAFHSPALPTR